MTKAESTDRSVHCGGTAARRHGGTAARRHGGTTARRHDGIAVLDESRTPEDDVGLLPELSEAMQ